MIVVCSNGIHHGYYEPAAASEPTNHVSQLTSTSSLVEVTPVAPELVTEEPFAAESMQPTDVLLEQFAPSSDSQEPSVESSEQQEVAVKEDTELTGS